MSTHYFSHLGGPSAVSKNGPSVHIMTNLCFCIRWDLRVTYCILVRLHRKISMHYFSCSGGPGMDSTKIAMGDVLHSGASGGICGSRIAFWCICTAKSRCTIFHARVGLVRTPQKSRWETYCILVRSGHKMLMNYFSCPGGASTDSTKSESRDVTPNLCFCIRCDLRARSAFWCIRGVKHQDTILHAQMGLVRIQQKERKDRLR
jgi:hypothetical protein